MADFIIAAVAVLFVGITAYRGIRNVKKGKSSCGCGCNSCPSNGQCGGHTKKSE